MSESYNQGPKRRYSEIIEVIKSTRSALKWLCSYVSGNDDLNHRRSFDERKDVYISTPQLSNLVYYVRKCSAPHTHDDDMLRHWDIKLASILSNIVFRGSLYPSWERILNRFIRVDLLENDFSFDLDNGLVQQLYALAQEIPDIIAQNDTSVLERRALSFSSDFSIAYFMDDIGWSLWHYAVQINSFLPLSITPLRHLLLHPLHIYRCTIDRINSLNSPLLMG